jgi:putative ABC transport system permease protein
VSSLLLRSGRRFLLGHRWQTLLAILGVALGVAIVIAVDLANQSAMRAFQSSMDAVTGRATHQIVGDPTGFTAGHYVALRRELGMRDSAPVIEGLVRVGEETFQLVGVDPFAEAAMRPALGGDAQADLTGFLVGPGALLARRTAARLGLVPGDSFTVMARGEAHRLNLSDVLTGDADVDGLVWVDIATAQTLLGRGNVLDRIDLRLDEATTARAIEAWLPPGLHLRPAEARGNAQREMTRAFRINLTAMSLLAIVVGGFLIYNTMTFSVLRRRRVLGIYRMLGVTRGEILRVILLETGLLALAGIALGLALGVLLAQLLLGLVVQTINDLYFQLTVSTVSLPTSSLAIGIGVGLAAALLAGLPAALEAGRTAPVTTQRRSALEATQLHRLPWLTGAGLLLMGLGYVWVQIPSRSLLPGFAALFFVIFGAALVAPALLRVASRLSAPLLARLLPGIGHLAARDTGAGLSRTGVAVAALGIAVAATIGVGIMTGSFRVTVAHWLDRTLQGDLYVAAPSDVSARVSGTLPAGLVDALRALDDAAALSTGRSIELEAGFGPVQTLVIEMAPASYDGFKLLAEAEDGAWPAFDRETSVLVSEPLAYHQQLTVGQALTLQTAVGARAFRVAGIFQDYGSDRGMLVMRRDLYDRLWNDPAVGTVGVYLDDPDTLPETTRRIRALLADYPEQALLRLTRDIRERSLEIFDRTFAVTDVLRLLVIGIAFVGILSALLAMQLERRRDHATLRALGVTPWQLWLLVAAQALLIALTALVVAVPLGLAMSQLLIDVINLRAFGWRLTLHPQARVFVDGAVLSLSAALLASLVPAWRIARTPPAEALREE